MRELSCGLLLFVQYNMTYIRMLLTHHLVVLQVLQITTAGGGSTVRRRL